MVLDKLNVTSIKQSFPGCQIEIQDNAISCYKKNLYKIFFSQTKEAIPQCKADIQTKTEYGYWTTYKELFSENLMVLIQNILHIIVSLKPITSIKFKPKTLNQTPFIFQPKISKPVEFDSCDWQRIKCRIKRFKAPRTIISAEYWGIVSVKENQLHKDITNDIWFLFRIETVDGTFYMIYDGVAQWYPVRSVSDKMIITKSSIGPNSDWSNMFSTNDRDFLDYIIKVSFEQD